MWTKFKKSIKKIFVTEPWVEEVSEVSQLNPGITALIVSLDKIKNASNLTDFIRNDGVKIYRLNVYTDNFRDLILSNASTNLSMTILISAGDYFRGCESEFRKYIQMVIKKLESGRSTVTFRHDVRELIDFFEFYSAV